MYVYIIYDLIFLVSITEAVDPGHDKAHQSSPLGFTPRHYTKPAL